jgi:hypothetical protein
MSIRLFVCLSLVLIFSACKQEVSRTYAQEAPSHSAFDALLKEYVDASGDVDYSGLQADSNRLNTYLATLSKHHPHAGWTEDEQLAYWINAYNAFTLQLIIRHYPIGSIKGITFVNIPLVHSPWDLSFIEVEGQRYDLNDIEHGIIRKEFEVPEIHFALVCAARSCPRLRREAYIPDQLDAQLADQARDFLSDTRKNIITKDFIQLSKLFTWYGGDFKRDGSLIDYINQYVPAPVDANARKGSLPYDWNLNVQLK